MKSAEVLAEMKDEWGSCTRCELAIDRTHVVFGEGNPNADVLIVAESPGRNEDIKGVPLVGKSGELLMEFYLHISTASELKTMREYEKGSGEKDPFDVKLIRKVLLKEVFLTNVIGCRLNTTGSRLADAWVFGCRPRLDEIILRVDPLVICVLGRWALRAVMGKHMPITKNQGSLLYSKTPGRTEVLAYPVVPMVHPAALLRNEDASAWLPGGPVYHAKEALRRAFWVSDILKNAYYGTQIPNRGATP